MLRKLLLSAAVVVLLCSGAFAGFGQMQGFSIDAVNRVARVGGVGSAEGGNIAMVGHAQRAYDACCGSAAIQEETAILTQSASAVGFGGATRVRQEASVDGSQGQLATSHGRRGLQAEGQSLDVSLDMTTRKAGGIGGAVGAQGVVGAQNQMEFSPGRIITNTQFVGAAQFSAVSGGPCSDASVNNSLDVTATQGQVLTGGPAGPGPRPPRGP
jgi:hypothetical protein